jgi:outer membrane cobalamin receptor
MRILALIILCCCVISINTGPGFAEQGPYRLDDIVVTAERTPTPLVVAPANVSIITKEDIQEMGARSSFGSVGWLLSH